MHYYKRNLGDYAKKAGKLSMLQHGAYTLLMDACYDREQFPTLEEAIDWTWASTPEEREAVAFVLKKFFALESGVYVQSRVQEDVSTYQAKAETNKRIAIERETNRRENSTTRVPVVNESPPNQEPLTTNQEPTAKEKKRKPVPKVADAPVFVLPDWVDPFDWDTWHSSAKRKKATDAQKHAAIKQLSKWRDEGLDHAQALASASVGGWQGLFAPRPSAAGHQVIPFQNAAARRAQTIADLTSRPEPINPITGAPHAANRQHQPDGRDDLGYTEFRTA